MQDTNKIVNLLVDAITASGTKFENISKQAIFRHLEKTSISPSEFEKIYQKLTDFYLGGKKTHKVQKVVDYNDTTHNDVKTRNPRKSVFKEIKKIAG